jgi:peroxiredoxin
MAWPAPRAFAQRCTNACWILLQNLSGGAQPVQEGKLAPDFTLSDASARPVTLSDYRGTVVSLNFWATWCLPCRTEIPWFVEFQQAYGGRGFAVLGVSLDDDGWQSVKPYIESKHVNYPVMTGSEEVAAQFGVASLPVTVLIDASGRIVSTHSGLVSRDTYRREIEVLLERAAARR